MNLFRSWVAPSVCLFALHAALVAHAEPSADDEEERTLRDAGLSSNGSALVTFFQARARTDINHEALHRLLHQFVSGGNEERVRATAELLGLGSLALQVLRQTSNDLDHREAAGRAALFALVGRAVQPQVVDCRSPRPIAAQAGRGCRRSAGFSALFGQSRSHRRSQRCPGRGRRTGRQGRSGAFAWTERSSRRPAGRCRYGAVPGAASGAVPRSSQTTQGCRGRRAAAHRPRWPSPTTPKPSPFSSSCSPNFRPRIACRLRSS